MHRIRSHRKIPVDPLIHVLKLPQLVSSVLNARETIKYRATTELYIISHM